MYAGSITFGVGQFCTNPGLIIGIESEELQTFIHELANEIQKVAPANMLHAGIAKTYSEKKSKALSQEDVETIAKATTSPKENQGKQYLRLQVEKHF